MATINRFTVCLAALLANVAALPATAADCEPERDRKAFVKCLICHTASADAGHLSGPNLWGIFGKPAGTVVGYTYSDAITQSGLNWDADTLRRYLADPSGFLPGTRMAMAPIRDAKEIDAIVCHLATLKE